MKVKQLKENNFIKRKAYHREPEIFDEKLKKRITTFFVK
jgi:hypothetical protein